jgi:hypothetical protein
MSEAASITVRVPLAIRRRPGRRTVVTPEGAAATAAPARTRADPAMLKALARAHRWQRMLDTGRYTSTGEMAAAERIERGYLGRVLQLTLLAPDIVEKILDRRQPDGPGLPRRMERLRVGWARQRIALSPGPCRGACPMAGRKAPSAA